MEKSYEKLIEYVKGNILNHNLHIGDKLPSERDLAEKLGISRNSIREGMKILERIGIVSSQHGAGNYILGEFSHTLTEVLSMMYSLQELEMYQITEFRHGLEYGAMNLAVQNATEEQKEKMLFHLQALDNAKTEKERVIHDKKIHYLLIESSQNKYMLINFIALTEIMDLYIPTMRGKILTSMKTGDLLYEAHRLIVEGVIQNDLDKGIKGLTLHFQYINDYQNP